MQLIEEMPLSALSELLSYAAECEIEKEIRPLWIAHFVISKIGNTETIPYDDFVNSILGRKTDNKNIKAPQDIEADFAGIIEADRRKRTKED